MMTEKTDQGDQYIASSICGGPISDVDRIESAMAKPMTSTRPQAACDIGLFDEGARNQMGLFDAPAPKDEEPVEEDEPEPTSEPTPDPYGLRDIPACLLDQPDRPVERATKAVTKTEVTPPEGFEKVSIFNNDATSRLPSGYREVYANVGRVWVRVWGGPRKRNVKLRKTAFEKMIVD